MKTHVLRQTLFRPGGIADPARVENVPRPIRLRSHYSRPALWHSPSRANNHCSARLHWQFLQARRASRNHFQNRPLAAGRPREIAETLRAAGLKVWIDEKELADFESITRGVQDNLARSKALLAFYSKTYPTRRACQWELTAAFIAAESEGDPRCRVLVVNPEPHTDHIQPIEFRDTKFRAATAAGDFSGITQDRSAALPD
jgi:hypothetical protein